ncbi:uncharacterized protein LOC130209432 isoform X4 [Pseudoliparis swirei]|uniref:uncharacterized protein LOC130209432 isoform X4 n=1 Tax=Pseudoliparis swirei TaxID=2059687 RepID=UPI0024BDEA12|nr:uncharacterized protein LOC130209432 isoform X4 [Pseudoliparis swirei]
MSVKPPGNGEECGSAPPVGSSRELMDLLRNLLWLWVIIVTIFAWIVISLIFVFINKCISRAGKHRSTQNLTAKSNQDPERSVDPLTPSLPPRTQFLTAGARSYESLAEDERHDCSDYEEYVPDDAQDLQVLQDPQDLQVLRDYEQDKQSDYVMVEDEDEPLPLHPRCQDADPEEEEEEDYDDIGGEDEHKGDEDYDDVG